MANIFDKPKDVFTKTPTDKLGQPISQKPTTNSTPSIFKPKETALTPYVQPKKSSGSSSGSSSSTSSTPTDKLGQPVSEKPKDASFTQGGSTYDPATRSLVTTENKNNDSKYKTASGKFSIAGSVNQVFDTVSNKVSPYIPSYKFNLGNAITNPTYELGNYFTSRNFLTKKAPIDIGSTVVMGGALSIAPTTSMINPSFSPARNMVVSKTSVSNSVGGLELAPLKITPVNNNNIGGVFTQTSRKTGVLDTRVKLESGDYIFGGRSMTAVKKVKGGFSSGGFSAVSPIENPLNVKTSVFSGASIRQGKLTSLQKVEGTNFNLETTSKLFRTRTASIEPKGIFTQEGYSAISKTPKKNILSFQSTTERPIDVAGKKVFTGEPDASFNILVKKVNKDFNKGETKFDFFKTRGSQKTPFSYTFGEQSQTAITKIETPSIPQPKSFTKGMTSTASKSSLDDITNTAQSFLPKSSTATSTASRNLISSLTNSVSKSSSGYRTTFVTPTTTKTSYATPQTPKVDVTIVNTPTVYPKTPTTTTYYNPTPTKTINYVPPVIPVPISSFPTPKPIPFAFPSLPSGSFDSSNFVRTYKGKQKKRYTPSYEALIFNIKGKAPKGTETGARIRPITKGFSFFNNNTKFKLPKLRL